MKKNLYIVGKIEDKIGIMTNLMMDKLNLKNIDDCGNIGVCFAFTDKKKAKKYAGKNPIIEGTIDFK